MNSPVQGQESIIVGLKETCPTVGSIDQRAFPLREVIEAAAAILRTIDRAMLVHDKSYSDLLTTAMPGEESAPKGPARSLYRSISTLGGDAIRTKKIRVSGESTPNSEMIGMETITLELTDIEGVPPITLYAMLAPTTRSTQILYFIPNGNGLCLVPVETGYRKLNPLIHKNRAARNPRIYPDRDSTHETDALVRLNHLTNLDAAQFRSVGISVPYYGNIDETGFCRHVISSNTGTSPIDRRARGLFMHAQTHSPS